MFLSASQKHFPDSRICFDDSCVERSSAPDVLRIKIDNFLVWESPLNHLNMYAKGIASHLQNGKPVKEYQFERSMLSQKVGGVLSTHGKFLDEMDRITNAFSQELTAEIFEKGL